jgi:phospholipid N-methyltransferase
MINFIKQFILHPRRTGAIMPSSPDLAKAMLSSVDFKKAKHIVELGPGTGAFTHLILQKMRKDAKLTLVELNKEFCKELAQINDKRLTIMNEDAQKLSKYATTADYVISGLPMNGFTKEQHRKILGEIKKITKNAYVQFHYSPLAEKYIKEYFSRVSKKTVLKNIPPAIVYTAKN